MASSKVLVVDDEIIIARDLEVRLKTMGYVVSGIASSGKESVRLAAQTKPDLVLMDVVVKGDMDGIEAAEEIQKRFKVPVIYVTAFTDEDTLARAKLTEPFGYLVKPFSERELKANIEMALYKHRMETRLHRFERWFTDTVHEEAHAVIAADREGRITFFNQGAEAITEWNRDEAIGRRVNDVFQLIDRASGTAVDLESAVEGPLVGLPEDTALIDRSRVAVPIHNTTTVLRDKDDLPIGTVSVFRDPTGTRHGAIAALNADVFLAVSKALTLDGMLSLCTESIVRHLHAALARIWVLDITGETLVLRASSGMYTHLDGEHGRIPVGKLEIGRIASERKPLVTNDAHHDPNFNDSEWARQEGIVAFAGYPLVVDERLLGVMGTFSKMPLTEGAIDALASISHSISVGVERKRLEEQLHQSQKSEALGQLAAGIAHDFNNLLTIIVGCSDLLLITETFDEENKSLVHEIENAATRAASLTRQLLTFSRKQVAEPGVLDLNGVVVNLQRMLRRLIGEEIEFSTILEPSVHAVVADIGQIEQVILNLALNSRDAMTIGGKLTIETANVYLDRNYALIRPEVTPGNYAMLAVSDTGCGMSPEVLNHVFQPFFTTKESGKGTGLGLATVYGIVKQWGGHLSIYSEPGLGSSFKVYLPQSARQQAATETNEALSVLPGGSETILVVEDDKAVRAMTTRILRTCGYSILDAGGGKLAINVAQQYEGQIDLLLTDVVMPQIGGKRLADRLSVLRPGIRILYISGYTDETVARHGVLRAETAFLQKPFAPRALAEKVRDVLDSPGPEDPPK